MICFQTHAIFYELLLNFQPENSICLYYMQFWRKVNTFSEDSRRRAGVGQWLGSRANGCGERERSPFLSLPLLFVNVFFRFNIGVFLFEFLKTF